MPFLRTKLLFLLLLLGTEGYSQNLSPESKASTPPKESSPSPTLKSKPIIETKVGYFFFSSSQMRQVYDGGWDVQFSSSIPVWDPFSKFSLNIYGSVEFLRCDGHSTEEHYKTYVWELPVNFGLKPVFLLSEHVQYYFAMGPRYFFIHQNNSSSYVDKNKSRNGIGFFVNTGFNFIPIKHLVIGLFSEYSFAKTHFHTSASNVYTKDIQVGGWTFGGSFGYMF